jgi:hypothetical protein
MAPAFQSRSAEIKASVERLALAGLDRVRRMELQVP